MIDDMFYLDLIGRPFHVSAWNCWTLCRHIWRCLGWWLPEYPYAERGKLPDGELRTREAQFIRLPHAVPWSIAVLRQRHAETHAGIVLPDCETFIHVSERHGTVITPLRRYRALLEGIFWYENEDNSYRQSV